METTPAPIIDAALVGKKVCVPARLDWGAGVVLRVATAMVQDAPQHRVVVQFPHATRTLLVPPARIDWPRDDPQRSDAGWIGTIGSNSLDDRLRRVSDDVLHVLGGIRARLAAVYPLFEVRDDEKGILAWARRQTGVGDPLTQWTRDELSDAFAAFCTERDAHLRGLAARLVLAEGKDALQAELAALEPDARARVEAALRRIV